MTCTELQGHGERLFGARWQTPLARRLGVNTRTLRRWIADPRKIPTIVAEKLSTVEQSGLLTDDQIDIAIAYLTRALTETYADDKQAGPRVRDALMGAAANIFYKELPKKKAEVQVKLWDCDCRHQIIRALWHLSGVRHIEKHARNVLIGVALAAMCDAYVMSLSLWPEV